MDKFDKQFLWKIDIVSDDCGNFYNIAVFDIDYNIYCNVYTEDKRIVDLFYLILIDIPTAILNMKHELLGGAAEIKLKSPFAIINYLSYKY